MLDDPAADFPVRYSQDRVGGFGDPMAGMFKEFLNTGGEYVIAGGILSEVSLGSHTIYTIEGAKKLPLPKIKSPEEDLRGERDERVCSIWIANLSEP